MKQQPNYHRLKRSIKLLLKNSDFPDLMQNLPKRLLLIMFITRKILVQTYLELRATIRRFTKLHLHPRQNIRESWHNLAHSIWKLKKEKLLNKQHSQNKTTLQIPLKQGKCQNIISSKSSMSNIRRFFSKNSSLPLQIDLIAKKEAIHRNKKMRLDSKHCQCQILAS